MSNDDRTKLAELERQQTDRVARVAALKLSIDVNAERHKADLDASIALRQAQIDTLRTRIETTAYPPLRVVA